MVWNTDPSSNTSANRLISSYIKGFVEVSNNLYANAGLTINGNATINGNIYASNIVNYNPPNQITIQIDTTNDRTSVSKMIPYQNGAYINTNDITMELDGNMNNGNTVITFGAKKTDMWVAGGQGGNTLAYSYDGINWQGLGTSIFSNEGQKSLWNGSMWVAGGGMGGNTLAYSYDGINWTGLGNITFNNWGVSLAWNGNMWLAGGNGGNSLAYSYDGINWNGLGNSIFSTGRAVVWNGRMWVAGGAGTYRLVYSYNGIDWNYSANGNAVFSNECSALAWNGRMWVAGGYDNTFAHSYDGINWIVDANVGLIKCSSVAWNGAMWVAAGNGNCSFVYSYDGIVWINTQTAASVFTNRQFGIAWNGSMWVGGAGSGNTLAFSYDGITWRGLGNSTFSSDNIPAVVANNRTQPNSITSSSTKMWVATGGNVAQGLAYSYDGINWTVANQNVITDGRAAYWNGSMWVAVGRSAYGVIAYSYDGINWIQTDISKFAGGYGFTVDWNGSMWVAGGNGGMVYSYDGITWYRSPNGGIFLNACRFVAHNNTMWVAVGVSGNTLAYSYDGINWIGRGTTIFSVDGLGIAWNGTMWVAAGNGGNSLAYSYDGINWNGLGTSILSYGWCVASNNYMFVAGGQGDNRLAYSYDGINWIISTSGNNIFLGQCLNLAWNGSMWVAGGYIGNTFAYSYDGINWVRSVSGNSVFPTVCYGVATTGNRKVIKMAQKMKRRVAVGRGGNTIAYSNDGVNWTGAGTSIIQGNSVATNGKMWVVAGGSQSETKIFESSHDYANNLTDIFTLTSPNAGKIDISFSSYTRTELNYDYLLFFSTESKRNEVMAFTETNQYRDLSVSGEVLYKNSGTQWLPVTFNYGTVYGLFRTDFSDFFYGYELTAKFSSFNTTNTTLARSNDGINWTGLGTSTFSTSANKVIWNNNLWVAGGQGGNTLAYSYNGTTWFPSTNGNPIFSNVKSLASSGKLWIAGGSVGKLAYSNNGISWTGIVSSPFTSIVNGLAYNGTMWVGVGSGGNTIAWSNDGSSNWTGVVSSPFSTAGNDVAWNGKMWMAVGTGGNTIASSLDGKTWTGLGSSIFTSSGNGIAWNGTRWLANGSGGNTLAYASLENGVWKWYGAGTSVFTQSGNSIEPYNNLGYNQYDYDADYLRLTTANTAQTNTLQLATEPYYQAGNSSISVNITSSE